MKNSIQKLIKLSSTLDNLGYYQEADELIKIIHKYASNDKLWRTANEVDLGRFYELYKESYEKSVGSAMSRKWFFDHAYGWIFFGDDNGYIAVRQQNSGLFKLAITAGKMSSIIKAQKDMQQTINSGDNTELRRGTPPGVWGLTTKRLANMMQKTGYHTMPGWLMKILQGKIKSLIEQVSNTGTFKTIQMDGGIVFEFDYNNIDINQLENLKNKEDIKIININKNQNETYNIKIEITKYYVADKNYYKWMLSQSTFNMPKLLINKIKKWIESLI